MVLKMDQRNLLTPILVAALVLAAGLWGYLHGRNSVQCPDADRYEAEADSLRGRTLILEYRLHLREQDTRLARARLDSALNAPKPTPKQHADYAFRASYGMAVGAIVDSLWTTPAE